MADKYLAVIQDGITSYIPNNANNIKFWTNQNKKVARSQYGQKEMVTIRPASEEEVAHMNQPVVSSAPVQKGPSEIEKMQALFAQQQDQIASQQLLINKLLLGATEPVINTITTPAKEEAPIPDPTPTDGEIKEKSKPGPKPKNNTDGQANQTENQQA
jgi:hypothetical protein